MELRRFGSSDTQVTPIGLGLAAAGRPGYINLGHGDDLRHDYAVEHMRQHAELLLDEAWRRGIRYFDAARSYGLAESFLGGWLRSRQIAPDAVAVGSKWGYAYTANWQVQAAHHEIKDLTLAQFQRQWPETETELGEYLDLYQIHSATLESGVLDDRALLAALAERKANGTLIGLSLSGPQQAATLRHALEIRIDGRLLFDSVQASWNVLEPSVGAALAEAYDAGLGVIIKEALANGRLTERNAEPDFASKRAVLEQQSARLDTTLDGLALAAALAQPWATVVLSGASTPAQVESNLAALAVDWDDEASAALGNLAEPADEYWQTRSRLPWN